MDIQWIHLQSIVAECGGGRIASPVQYREGSPCKGFLSLETYPMTLRISEAEFGLLSGTSIGWTKRSKREISLLGVPPLLIHSDSFCLGFPLINHTFWATTMTMETPHIWKFEVCQYPLKNRKCTKVS